MRRSATFTYSTYPPNRVLKDLGRLDCEDDLANPDPVRLTQEAVSYKIIRALRCSSQIADGVYGLALNMRSAQVSKR